MSATPPLRPSRLLPADVLHVGSIGLRTRRLRAALSALGIAIGIASMVAVLGISASSRADLLAALDRLGTNLLTLEPGQSFFGDDSELPEGAAARVRLLGDVERAAAIYVVPRTTVQRNAINDDENGLAVYAADRGLPAALGAELTSGRFLTVAGEHFPTVRAGVDRGTPPRDLYRRRSAARVRRRALVRRRGHPRPGRARLRDRPRRADRPAGGDANLRDRRRSDEALRARRPTTPSIVHAGCSPWPRTRSTRRRSTSVDRPTRWRRRPPPRARSLPCCSGSARSRCSSAASGSRT